MRDSTSRFTSDRRGPRNATWASEGDWDAGVGEGVSISGGSLVGQGSTGGGLDVVVDENFTTFDSSIWSLYGSATHSSGGEYVQLHPASYQAEGSLAYDRGMSEGLREWAIDLTWSQNNSDTDEITINWYAETPPGGIRSAQEGYVLGFDYWRTTAFVVYRSAEGSDMLASAYIREATGILDVRLEWLDGSFTVYYNGAELMSGVHSVPNYSRDGLFFGSWNGGQESYKRIHRLSLTWDK